MEITIKDVEYIANLARLKLSQEAKDEMSSDLKEILEYVDQLNEVNTEQVEPTAHVLSINNVLRKDIQKSSLSREAVLKVAPQASEEGFYKVPQIIE
ncbi:Asp-tRNA(Asn)/Glu-tRNA(Gln) amidotransferase subunit GatC [Candidatus Auribacterota bacterium]